MTRPTYKEMNTLLREAVAKHHGEHPEMNFDERQKYFETEWFPQHQWSVEEFRNALPWYVRLYSKLELIIIEFKVWKMCRNLERLKDKNER